MPIYFVEIFAYDTYNFTKTRSSSVNSTNRINFFLFEWRHKYVSFVIGYESFYDRSCAF